MNYAFSLFDLPPVVIMGDRDGETFDRARDLDRLDNAMGRIYTHMKDRGWYTLAELAEAGDCSEAGAAARVRDLRKKKFGGFIVDHMNCGGGLWKYRFTGEVNPDAR
jgi:hypothetical protein